MLFVAYTNEDKLMISSAVDELNHHKSTKKVF